MFHCNVRSLPNNLVLLEDFLYSLDKRPEILAITETRLNENSVCNVDLSNYGFYHTDSPTLAGGAAIYITKTLNSIPRPDIKFNMQLVESCWVEIDPGNGKAPILIGSIYRHPGAKIEEFTKQLDDFIKKLQNRYQLYRKRPCISRTFFHKIEAKNRGCGLSTDTSMFGVLKNLLIIHKTS